MFTLTISLPNESWCSNLLRNVRWRKGNVVCPRCHSYDTKKDGQYRFYQKYFCKQCERWFNDKTGCISLFTYTVEKMVPDIVSVLCTVAWLFNKRDIIWGSSTISKMLQVYQNCYGKVIIVTVALSTTKLGVLQSVMNSTSKQAWRVDYIMMRL